MRNLKKRLFSRALKKKEAVWANDLKVYDGDYWFNWLYISIIKRRILTRTKLSKSFSTLVEKIILKLLNIINLPYCINLNKLKTITYWVYTLESLLQYSNIYYNSCKGSNFIKVCVCKKSSLAN